MFEVLHLDSSRRILLAGMKDEDEIFELIAQEKKRQQNTLMMIPSENYTYPEVREAVGSVLMHKYAEGYPSKRYYQGQEYVDDIERLCQRRALEAFNLDPEVWGVNVQAYSGTPANIAVYNALLNPGDTIMPMYLLDGGHLSHGWSYNGKNITFTSKIFNIDFYNVESETQTFDYRKLALRASQVKPKLVISGGTAYPREIDHRRMGRIAHREGAYYLADVAHEAGLIAAGVQNSPFNDADVVTMTTHKTLRGPRGALIFARRELMPLINESVFPGLQGGPHMHTIAGIAVALEKTKTKEFRRYAAQTIENAKYLAQVLKSKGFDIVSGGTEKHLILIDLREKKTNGWFVAWALEVAGIIVNKNTIPADTGSPYYPSGLRLGTPAVTTRGMQEREMKQIADWISEVVAISGEHKLSTNKEERQMYLKEYKENIKRNNSLHEIAEEVKELCSKYPADLD